METEYFDWDGWDKLDIAAFHFYNCVMKKDFGPLKKGEKYKVIYINYEKGDVEVYVEDDNITKFKVRMVPDVR